MTLSRRHLLGIEELSAKDIELILETAQKFREINRRPLKKVPTLRGRSVITLFFEPSTRTRSSFELAAKRLGADTINVSLSSSSVVKGESLIDTARTLQALNPDVIVLRHSSAGAPQLLARWMDTSHLINAGDGMHEHPTQALLDAMTILDHRPQLKNLRVTIIGDLAHSRVARSNVLLLKKMKARVTVSAPPTLIPAQMEQYGVEIETDVRRALRGAQVVMMLRTQLERQHGAFYPTVKEYFNLYGLNAEKMSEASADAIVLHPGPVNRGVEIDPEIVDGGHSVILEQVENGLAIRMAALYLLAGSGEGIGL